MPCDGIWQQLLSAFDAPALVLRERLLRLSAPSFTHTQALGGHRLILLTAASCLVEFFQDESQQLRPADRDLDQQLMPALFLLCNFFLCQVCLICVLPNCAICCSAALHLTIRQRHYLVAVLSASFLPFSRGRSRWRQLEAASCGCSGEFLAVIC